MKHSVLVSDTDGKPQVIVLAAVTGVTIEPGVPAVPEQPAQKAVEAQPGTPASGAHPGTPPVEAQPAKKAVPAQPAKPPVAIIHRAVGSDVRIFMKHADVIDLLNSN